MPPQQQHEHLQQQQQQQHHEHLQQQRPPIAWLPASWTLALTSVLLCISAFVSRHAPEAYMDEPFHVPMTQRYCAGDVLYWDPKVTTFPGLYVLGAGYAWLARLALAWSGADLEVTCGTAYLRSLNVLLAVACIQVAAALSTEVQRAHSSSSSSSDAGSHETQQQQEQQEQEQERQEQADRAAGVALLVGLLPTQLFFAFLFYTDVPALLFLLLTELLLLRGATYGAAAAGAAAIAMRQTNAVWVAFLTGAAMLQQLLQPQAPQAAVPKGPAQRAAKGDGAAGRAGPRGPARHHHQHQQQPQQQGVAGELLCLLQRAWAARAALLRAFAPLLLLPAGFCAFVLANGSITLGDKEAHAPSAHLMQPLYFGLFCLGAAGPLLLQPGVAGRLSAVARARPLAALALVAAAVAVGCGLAARYSLEHPYLLADNRHYTFYLWRKVIKRHWAARYCLMPLYVAGWALLLAGLSATQHWLWVAAFVASCCVTLVPAWLLEFRYFTAPFALAVLHLPAPPRRLSLLLAGAYACANVLTLVVFALRPFAWADGSVARFMW